MELEFKNPIQIPSHSKMDHIYNICQTCLSGDRQLYPLSVLRNLLPELECYIEEIKESIGGVCWECRSHMLKFFKFKAKVRKAQDTMWDWKFNKKNLNLNSVSTLSVSYKQTYDYEYTCNEEIEIKTEPPFMTQETDITDCEMDDVKPLIEIGDVYIGFVNAEDKETIQSDKKAVIVPKEEKLDDVEMAYSDEENHEQTKFCKTVFTEEEMQASRELKRSHPNYIKVPLKCYDCVLGFVRQNNYDLHMKKKHGVEAGPLLCDICKVRYPSDFELTKHRSQHYKCYQCNLCQYKSTAIRAIRSHCSGQHMMHTANKIHCKHCDVIVETVEKLKEHIEETHKHTCDTCGETFKGKWALGNHERRIHGEKRKLICDICTKSFRNRTCLESHIVTHDAGVAKRLAYCAKCDVQYKSIYVYKDHLKRSVNHSTALFQCSDCDKKFASEAYWKQHRNCVHLRKWQRKCKLCNEVFKTKWSLKKHNVTHHGVERTRNYSCDDCGKEFFEKGTLKQHMNSHTGKRPYVCGTCGATFSYSAALYTHKKNHKRCRAMLEQMKAKGETNSESNGELTTN